MRRALALTVLVHLTLLAAHNALSSDRPRPPRLLPPPPVTPGRPAPPVALMDTLSLYAIDRIYGIVNRLMETIQSDTTSVQPVKELAQLDLLMGWDEQAIPALARALELEPGAPDLRRDLEAALRRLGRADADVAALAREFMELVAMWGHGC
jgi:hypothetical protein